MSLHTSLMNLSCGRRSVSKPCCIFRRDPPYQKKHGVDFQREGVYPASAGRSDPSSKVFLGCGATAICHSEQAQRRSAQKTSRKCAISIMATLTSPLPNLATIPSAVPGLSKPSYLLQPAMPTAHMPTSASFHSISKERQEPPSRTPNGN